MSIKSLIYISIIGLISFGAHAESFQGDGTIQQVQREKYIVEINNKLYSLPQTVSDRINPSTNTEIESLPTSGQAVIFQLQKGSMVKFSGIKNSPYDVIDTLQILTNPISLPSRGLISE